MTPGNPYYPLLPPFILRQIDEEISFPSAMSFPVSMSTPHASHFCLPRRKLIRIALQHNATLGRCQTHMRMLNYPPNSKRKAGRSYLSGHIWQIIPWSMSRVRSCLPFWAFFSVLNLLSTDPEWPGLPGWQVGTRALPGFVWFPAPVPSDPSERFFLQPWAVSFRTGTEDYWSLPISKALSSGSWPLLCSALWTPATWTSLGFQLCSSI